MFKKPLAKLILSLSTLCRKKRDCINLITVMMQAAAIAKECCRLYRMISCYYINFVILIIRI